MKTNKQVQAIEKAIAAIEKENKKMAKGYRQGKNNYSFASGEALMYLEKAKAAAENYNFELLKY